MDEFLEMVYVSELKTQCVFALNAIRALNNVMPRYSDPGLDFDTQATLQSEIFRTLHSFLAHSSNASKILWPERGGHPNSGARAMHLRTLLEVDDAHILRRRTLRNHLEHFDHRLDTWADESVDRNYVQDSIGQIDAFAGLDPGDCMRWYDPSTLTMHFRGDSFSVQELTNGVDDLLQRASKYLQHRRARGD